MRKQEQLTTRFEQEYGVFVEEIKRLDKQQIIDKAYEIVTKTDILSLIQCENYYPHSIEPLLAIKNPLDAVYSKWLKADKTSIEDLQETIDKTAKEAQYFLNREECEEDELEV